MNTLVGVEPTDSHIACLVVGVLAVASLNLRGNSAKAAPEHVAPAITSEHMMLDTVTAKCWKDKNVYATVRHGRSS